VLGGATEKSTAIPR